MTRTSTFVMSLPLTICLFWFKEIWQLSCFTEEVPGSISKMWIDHYQKYRADMKKAMELTGLSKDNEADRIIQKYKQVNGKLSFYHHDGFLPLIFFFQLNKG